MSFKDAFIFAMKSEIGPWFDPSDPDVIAGLHDTPEQKRKIGYVNIKGDRGGLTSYGIAQNSHPHIDVSKINLAQAMEIYRTEFWIPARCEELPPKYDIAHFDAAVNHGVVRARKLLQEGLGVTADGVIGPGTLNALKKPIDPVKFMKARRSFYQNIINARPDQQKFAKGWELRGDRVLALLQTSI
jgi:lysozyme family protein